MKKGNGRGGILATPMGAKRSKKVKTQISMVSGSGEGSSWSCVLQLEGEDKIHRKLWGEILEGGGQGLVIPDKQNQKTQRVA